jgi:hypothetical protein
MNWTTVSSIERSLLYLSGDQSDHHSGVFQVHRALQRIISSHVEGLEDHHTEEGDAQSTVETSDAFVAISLHKTIESAFESSRNVLLFTADIGSETSTGDFKRKGNKERSRSGETAGEKIPDPEPLILIKGKDRKRISD